MAIKTFSVGEVLTASDTNTYLANSGLVYVASKTFTSTSSAQQIDNCFTSSFDQYRITYAGVGSTTGSDFIYMRLVDGTTPVTTALYYYGSTASNTGGPVGAAWIGSQSQWKIGLIGDNVAQFSMDLANPQTTAKTTAMTQYFDSATGDAYFGTYSCLYNAGTQFEGLYMYPGSGTWSGTITVMGYRKA